MTCLRSLNNFVSLPWAAVSRLLPQTFDSFFLSGFILMSYFISYRFFLFILLVLQEWFGLIAQEGYKSLFS